MKVLARGNQIHYAWLPQLRYVSREILNLNNVFCQNQSYVYIFCVGILQMQSKVNEDSSSFKRPHAFTCSLPNIVRIGYVLVQ